MKRSLIDRQNLLVKELRERLTKQNSVRLAEVAKRQRANTLRGEDLDGLLRIASGSMAVKDRETFDRERFGKASEASIA